MDSTQVAELVSDRERILHSDQWKSFAAYVLTAHTLSQAALVPQEGDATVIRNRRGPITRPIFHRTTGCLNRL